MTGNITEVESGSRKAYDEEYLPAEAPDTAHQFSSGIKAPPRDYSIPGKKTSKIFTTIRAAANLVFAFNTGMLPEIQATVRKPVVINMLSALYFHFTAGVLPMYAVAFLGVGHMDLLLRHICLAVSTVPFG